MALGSSIANAAGDIGQMKELRQRLFFVIGAIIVFRIGSFIPLPGIDPVVLAALAAAAELVELCTKKMKKYSMKETIKHDE